MEKFLKEYLHETHWTIENKLAVLIYLVSVWWWAIPVPDLKMCNVVVIFIPPRFMAVKKTAAQNNNNVNHWGYRKNRQLELRSITVGHERLFCNWVMDFQCSSWNVRGALSEALLFCVHWDVKNGVLCFFCGRMRKGLVRIEPFDMYNIIHNRWGYLKLSSNIRVVRLIRIVVM